MNSHYYFFHVQLYTDSLVTTSMVSIGHVILALQVLAVRLEFPH